jgi:hypothetical protein
MRERKNMNEFLPEDYRKIVNNEIQKRMEMIGKGKAETYPRYREMVGQIRGLKDALELFGKAMKDYGEDDD